MTDSTDIAKSLAALGHEARLAVFRLLVKAGDGGLTVGEIAAHLDMAPSTLAHHLRALTGAGLIVQQKNGREVLNRVDYAAVHQTLAYLTDECCVGVELKPVGAAA